MIDDEVYDFLEHHGVKGQRWGIRKEQRNQMRFDRLMRVASGTATRQDRLKEASKKIAKNAAFVGVGVGATLVVGILAKKGAIPMSEARRMADQREVDVILSAKRAFKIHELTKGQLHTARQVREFVQKLQ